MKEVKSYLGKFYHESKEVTAQVEAIQTDNGVKIEKVTLWKPVVYTETCEKVLHKNGFDVSDIIIDIETEFENAKPESDFY